MKRIWPVLLCLTLLLAACGPSAPADTPEEALNQFLTHMKRGEYAEADDYVYTKDEDALLSDDLKNFDGGNRAFVDKIQAFDYELKEEQIGDTESTVQVSSTHHNMVPVFTDVMAELTTLILGDPATQGLNDEQMMEKVNGMLAERTATLDREQSILTVEKEFPVTLQKDGNRWKVDMDNEELVLMLTGNIFQSASDQNANETDE